MITKEKEYMASTYQVAGFAFMTPFCRIWLDPINIYKDYGLLAFIGYVIISLFICLIGVILVDKGRDIVSEHWRN